MKRPLTLLMTLLLSLAAFAEMRYIEIGSISNATIIRLGKFSDFEFLISKNNDSVAFFQSSSGDLLINSGGTYYAFYLNGYRTIEDFKKGESSGFDNGKDFAESQALGTATSEMYYFFKKNSFASVQDCSNAMKSGFDSSSEYYAAKEKGFSRPTDYREYLTYTRQGYKTKDDWKLSEKLGFSASSAFYDAQKNGFKNNDDYQKAKRLGFSTEKDYRNYLEIEKKLNKIVSDKAMDRRNAFVYYHIQLLPKGESALNVLSLSLKNLYGAHSPETKNAFSLYLSGMSTTGTVPKKTGADASLVVPSDIYYGNRKNSRTVPNLEGLFSEQNLKAFFLAVEIKELGTYSSQSEIFKRR